MVNIIPAYHQHVSIVIVSMLASCCATYNLTEPLVWLFMLAPTKEAQREQLD